MSAGLEQPTLIRTLLDVAQHQPERRAFTYLAMGGMERARLSFGDLDLRAKAIGAELTGRGLDGGRAVLVYPSGLDFLCGFFGCAYAGVVAVPLPIPRTTAGFARLESIVADVSPSAVLTTAEYVSGLDGGGTHLPSIIATDLIEDGAESCWRCPGTRGSDLALIQYTSGSTSEPKGVMVTHENLRANSAALAACFDHQPNSVMVTWLPMFHDMGLIYTALGPVYGGFGCVMLSPQSFLRRPAAWLEAISRYGGTHSAAPNFGYELCARQVSEEQKRVLSLESWRVALNGAEPIRAATLRRFSSAFASAGFRSEAFCPGYGLAEATVMVAGCRAGDVPTGRYRADQEMLGEAQPIGELSEGTGAVVSVGSAALDTTITIVSTETFKECAPGLPGEIWVSGPGVAKGYWNKPESTRATFVARLLSRRGTFLRTGDLGAMADGHLYILGRFKDLIIVAGRNIQPQEIEETVEACHPAIRSGCVAAFAVDGEMGEELAVVAGVADSRLQAESAGPELVGLIRARVAEVHELRAASVELVRPADVPRTTSGKVQRGLCRERFLAGWFAGRRAGKAMEVEVGS